MPKPLTKLDATGELYVRPPEIDVHIDAVLQLDFSNIGKRLDISNSESSDHIRSECLVHLVREYHRAGDRIKANLVLVALLSRCDKVLESRVSADMIAAREEALGQFSELLAEDATTNPGAAEVHSNT